jgi:hypothetical protein
MFEQNQRWIAKFVSNELKKIRKERYSFGCSCNKHKTDLLNKLKSFGNVPYIQNKETLHGKIRNTIIKIYGRINSWVCQNDGFWAVTHITRVINGKSWKAHECAAPLPRNMRDDISVTLFANTTHRTKKSNITLCCQVCALLCVPGSEVKVI